ncbi:hypothetical protein [Candidatus Venteria ishoeyi]|uniref:Uncharacterized protein n=1 Tax=Candidatus Venteria ishoeyi TaxID=1899563 RepID=A0A1H6F5D8_9GAMM|nr:hypothetical protein [Candidatus Venteria ishoeyi]SEH04601.1 Uncharacterised protein [Candidatus Venteria ishoeyi]
MKYSIQILVAIIMNSFPIMGIAQEEVFFSNPKKVTETGDSIAVIFSPTNNNIIAYTDRAYSKIYTLSLDNSVNANTRRSMKSISVVSEKSKSGFGFQWTDNGENIVFRAGEFGSSEVILVNIDGNEYTSLTEKVANVSIPILQNNKISYLKDGMLVSQNLPYKGARRHSEYNVNFFQKNGKIVLDSNQISPKNIACFLPKISPNLLSLSYECIDGSLYVYNIITKNTVLVGLGSNIKWSSNGMKLVYERPFDNGYEIISSDIFIVNIDGTNPVNLTDNIDLIVRRPALSHDGKKIATDIDGDIYIADLHGAF